MFQFFFQVLDYFLKNNLRNISCSPICSFILVIFSSHVVTLILISSFLSDYFDEIENILFFIQDGLFRGCLRMRGGQKGGPSMKAVTQIQQ